MVLEAQVRARDLTQSRARRVESVKETGWTGNGYLPHVLRAVSGAFDQQKDVVIDAMHGFANVIKPLCHITVDVVHKHNVSVPPRLV